MLLEKLFEHLALKVHPFATCMVAEGWRLLLPDPVHVTLHYILEGEGKLRVGSGEFLPLPTNALAIMPPGIEHAIQCGTVDHETGVEGQGDPEAALCELIDRFLKGPNTRTVWSVSGVSGSLRRMPPIGACEKPVARLSAPDWR